MATLEEALRSAKGLLRPHVDAFTAGAGERTMVGGHEIEGNWESAQAERVQTFLNQNDWGKDAFMVSLPYRAYQSPWNAKNGSSVIRVSTGATGVIRKLDIEGKHKLIALVVMTVRT